MRLGQCGAERFPVQETLAFKYELFVDETLHNKLRGSSIKDVDMEDVVRNGQILVRCMDRRRKGKESTVGKGRDTKWSFRRGNL